MLLTLMINSHLILQPVIFEEFYMFRAEIVPHRWNISIKNIQYKLQSIHHMEKVKNLNFTGNLNGIGKTA